MSEIMPKNESAGSARRNTNLFATIGVAILRAVDAVTYDSARAIAEAQMKKASNSAPELDLLSGTDATKTEE